MKTLILVRHAKSDWGHPFLKDIDRPLNARGYMDAYRMNQWLKKNNIEPQGICCSPATRAYSTASILLRDIVPIQDHSRFMIFEELYELSSTHYVNFIKSISDQYDSVMLFGHNSAMTHTVNQLGCSVENVPTCGLYLFESSAKKWKDFSENPPRLVKKVFPSELK